MIPLRRAGRHSSRNRDWGRGGVDRELLTGGTIPTYRGVLSLPGCRSPWIARAAAQCKPCKPAATVRFIFSPCFYGFYGVLRTVVLCMQCLSPRQLRASSPRRLSAGGIP